MIITTIIIHEEIRTMKNWKRKRDVIDHSVKPTKIVTQRLGDSSDLM